MTTRERLIDAALYVVFVSCLFAIPFHVALALATRQWVMLMAIPVFGGAAHGLYMNHLERFSRVPPVEGSKKP